LQAEYEAKQASSAKRHRTERTRNALGSALIRLIASRPFSAMSHFLRGEKSSKQQGREEKSKQGGPAHRSGDVTQQGRRRDASHHVIKPKKARGVLGRPRGSSGAPEAIVSPAVVLEHSLEQLLVQADVVGDQHARLFVAAWEQGTEKEGAIVQFSSGQ
jgi:hypothetical protein